MLEHIWATSSRISMSGPSGWAPVERLEVHHASGRAVVRVERFPVDPDATIDDLAEQHSRRLAVDAASDSGITPHEVLGSSDGRRRTVASSDRSGAVQTVADYLLDSGRLVVVTVVTPVGDVGLAEEAAAIAASASIADPVRIPTDELPLRPGQVDFGDLARAWRAGTTPEARSEHLITTEESFGAARHFGVAMLPGADIGRWDQLDADQRRLTAAVAWRSLEARGAAADSDLAEALELAASHDLILLVAEQRGEESAVRWYAARPDRVVRLRPRAPGLIALSTHPAADLADLVLADLVLSDGAPDGTVTASAVHRVDGRVVGDETSWSAEHDPREIREALVRLVTHDHTADRAV